MILDFHSTDDILKILQKHPDIQRIPKADWSAIVAAVVSLVGAGVGFALTIHLGGVGALAGGNLTLTAVIKLAGSTALASAGTSGKGKMANVLSLFGKVLLTSYDN